MNNETNATEVSAEIEPADITVADLRITELGATANRPAAVKAMLAMRGRACDTGDLDETVETVMADMIADMHYLADALGIDWATVADKADTYYDES